MNVSLHWKVKSFTMFYGQKIQVKKCKDYKMKQKINTICIRLSCLKQLWSQISSCEKWKSETFQIDSLEMSNYPKMEAAVVVRNRDVNVKVKESMETSLWAMDKSLGGLGSLCLFGKDKTRRSIENSIAVVGVKKALLIGKKGSWNCMK